MRHGPHHGAQKSTTTGSSDAAMAESKTSADGLAIGSPGAPSAAWHLPQRVSAASLTNGSRLRCPHDGQATIAPLLSRSAMAHHLINQGHEALPMRVGARIDLDLTSGGVAQAIPKVCRTDERVERRH